MGSAAHIPVTTTLFAAEAFGMELIISATTVCFIGTLVARNDTIYRETYVSKENKSRVVHHFGPDLDEQKKF